jgi:hypothetical protein
LTRIPGIRSSKMALLRLCCRFFFICKLAPVGHFAFYIPVEMSYLHESLRWPFYWAILQNKYWRNNLLELGPSFSGFLDKLVSFPRLVYQTNVLNPFQALSGTEPYTSGVAAATITTVSFRPLLRI